MVDDITRTGSPLSKQELEVYLVSFFVRRVSCSQRILRPPAVSNLYTALRPALLTDL